MSIRNIVIWPCAVLNERAAEILNIDNDIKIFAQDLVDTCIHVKGLGLAAPQCNLGARLFVLDVGAASGTRDGYEAFINPVQVIANGSIRCKEGCLSVPGVQADIERFSEYGIEYTDIDGKKQLMSGKGRLAQALQHEMDHLDGMIIVKRMSVIKRTPIRKKMELLKKRMRQKCLSYFDIISAKELEDDGKYEENEG